MLALIKKDSFWQKTISSLFAGLFFLLPLFFTPYNSELFEFNKILLLYTLTILILAAWAVRMILRGKFFVTKTFLDIPLVLFFFSQLLSTLFSIDRHTSFWGYYSRFNGGLLSTITFLLLYWAWVSNCQAKEVMKVIKVSFASAFLVSIYGILEHFGHSFSCLLFERSFNVACWVQDVQNRVFATLGQPNWLAAYLAILIPVAASFFIKAKSLKAKAVSLLLTLSYFLCLLFTRSRSGFLGWGLGMAIFFLRLAFRTKKAPLATKPLLVLALGFLLSVLVFGTPFSSLNRFVYYQSWLSSDNRPSVSAPVGPALEVGGTESGEIRKIVWKGAWEVFKHSPWLGTGVETFAYSYYHFRPVEHNLVSEWDFLYNKAHNEYLNYLATTGIVGLGTYLAFIVFFIFSGLKKLWAKDFSPQNETQLLSFSLFIGWLTILVSNFFGFSVVLVSLYFFLIPALVFSLNQEESEPPAAKPHKWATPLFILLFLIVWNLLRTVVNLWRADAYYAQAQKLSKQNQYVPAYEQFSQAVRLSPGEPVFLSDFSAVLANLTLLSFNQKEATAAAQLRQKAIDYSNQAVAISPYNLNLLKTRVKVFYTLSTLELEPVSLEEAVSTLKTAIALAPTDPKLLYNLGLLYAKDGQVEKALETIQKAIELKPNYEEARNALALFYEDLGENKKAIEQLEYILKTKKNDPELQERLEKLKSF